ncbi:MAG TPA: hypothetical protein ENF42_04260 [Candidatus Bathyarchaeota archaeon]|nr:hypothetical protein [Candidatus Bathyarchaeota archaeon]
MVKGNLKVSGGKLLSLEFKVKDGKLKDVIISGDFFMMPEEEIYNLEETLEGATAKIDEIEGLIRGFFRGREVLVLGFSADDLISLFRRLLDSI